ncbi:hypothetical protein BD413DRAFT_603740 [Trametes elegans]|nr:hypothetical protein BD413DRAFT_603740 [Trametes elegans]
MSGLDDLCSCLAICCSCFAVSCNGASNLWCFYRTDDVAFERTVEELYAPTKQSSAPSGPDGGPSAHVLALQPRGKDATVSTQPGARASMSARRAAAADVLGVPRTTAAAAADADANENGTERVPGEPRAERRDRTREWVHAHSRSEPVAASPPSPAPDAEGQGEGRARPRSKTQGEADAVRGSAVRGPRAQGAGHRAQPSDAQEYVRTVERHWKRSEDGERGRGSGEGKGADTLGRGAGQAEGQRTEPAQAEAAAPAPKQELEGAGESSSAPRLDIPASLRPGRPLSFDPGMSLSQAIGDIGQVGKEAAEGS